VRLLLTAPHNTLSAKQTERMRQKAGFPKSFHRFHDGVGICPISLWAVTDVTAIAVQGGLIYPLEVRTRSSWPGNAIHS
jgi:hypothetical protein